MQMDANLAAVAVSQRATVRARTSYELPPYARAGCAPNTEHRARRVFDTISLPCFCSCDDDKLDNHRLKVALTT